MQILRHLLLQASSSGRVVNWSNGCCYVPVYDDPVGRNNRTGMSLHALLNSEGLFNQGG